MVQVSMVVTIFSLVKAISFHQGETFSLEDIIKYKTFCVKIIRFLFFANDENMNDESFNKNTIPYI